MTNKVKKEILRLINLSTEYYGNALTSSKIPKTKVMKLKEMGLVKDILIEDRGNSKQAWLLTNKGQEILKQLS